VAELQAVEQEAMEELQKKRVFAAEGDGGGAAEGVGEGGGDSSRRPT